MRANRILNLMILLSLQCFWVGCNEEDVEYPTNYRFVEIVTVVKNDKGMELEKVGLNDSGITKLITNQWVDEYIAEGRRVIVEYEVANENIASNPMPVNLLQMGLIAFDTLKSVSRQEIEQLEKPKVELISLWRTGDFINLQTALQYDGKNQILSIVADESTREDSTVVCYLYNRGETVGENYVSRHSYGSYYIGDIWNSETLERIRLFVNDEKSYVDIVKNSY